MRDIFSSSRANSNCSKSDPSTCQLHGSAYRAKQEFIASITSTPVESPKPEVSKRETFLARARAKMQADREFREKNPGVETEWQKKERLQREAFVVKAHEDFEASWKPRVEKDGATTISVYRSGNPAPPAERGVERDSYLTADALKPEGRQGRMDAVFASPSLGGVTRWVKGNDGLIDDLKVRELRIDVDKTYVYSVHAWERASSSWDYEKSTAGTYWDSGMTVREYMEKAKADPATYDPQEWELLVPADGIRSVKRVGAETVSSRAYEDWVGEDVAEILSRRTK